jgi:hypothetical protein
MSDVFAALKEAFISAPMLRHLDPTRETIIETDASGTAIAAILSQRQEDDGLFHPVMFMSRSLKTAERNYHVHDQELLAIVEAFKGWRHYILSLTQKVKVYTDHKNLEYFTTRHDISKRQLRWSETLGNFSYTLVFRKGQENSRADALSRIEEPGDTKIQGVLVPGDIEVEETVHVAVARLMMEPGNEIEDRIRTLQPNDPWLQNLVDKLNQSTDNPEIRGSTLTDGLVYKDDRLCVPDDTPLKTDIISAYHDPITAGHPGTLRTFELVSRDYFWPGMKRFVKNFVRSCDQCQRTKIPRRLPYGTLQSLPVPERPWTSLSMDFITDLPASNGFDSILVIVDRLTKMARFITVKKTITAVELADVFIEHIFANHGVSTDIVSDRGSVFLSRFWSAFLDTAKIKGKYSTAFHPQTDGQTERVNQALEQFLRLYTARRQDDWADLLPFAQFTYNNTLNASTKQTPFFANYGYNPTYHFDVPAGAATMTASHDRLQNLETLHKEIHASMALAQKDHARYYDQHHKEHKFEVGDQVLLSRRNIKTKRPSAKLDDRYLGPFTVLERIGKTAYRLDLPRKMRIHKVFHVSLLKEYVASDLPRTAEPPPSPLEIDDELEYEVDEILNSRRTRDGNIEYLVVWLGWNEQGWEPLEHLTHCTDRLREFHTRFPRKPRPNNLDSILSDESLTGG